MKRVYTGNGVKFVEETPIVQETVIDLDEEINTIEHLKSELDKKLARLGILEKDMSVEEKTKYKDKLSKAKAKK